MGPSKRTKYGGPPTGCDHKWVITEEEGAVKKYKCSTCRREARRVWTGYDRGKLVLYKAGIAIPKLSGDDIAENTPAFIPSEDRKGNSEETAHSDDWEPTALVYIAALQSIADRITHKQRTMLLYHAAQPNCMATAAELATAAQFEDFRATNLQYGRFGSLVADATGYCPGQRSSSFAYFVRDEQRPDCQWWLRTPFVEALRRMGWGLSAGGPVFVRDPNALPHELTPGPYAEGAAQLVLVNRYERDPMARKKCIEVHGTACSACGFSFGDVYGPMGNGFIHVHHLTPLSNGPREVDPVRDLRPVCPNCHAMLHTSDPPLTIEELVVRLGR